MTIVRLKFHAREIGNSCTNLSSSRIRAQWRCDGTGYKAPRNRRRAIRRISGATPLDRNPFNRAVSVFSKGQCETVAYRFLGKRGGYAWVVTQATLIHCSKQQKPLSVVCVNYILR